MAPDVISSTPEGFVDFGAMVIDDTGPRSTRMRTETPDVAPDEQDTFRDALAEFKRALDQNLPIEDHQAHYDLGIAFKEMGLLDEAISEFQKALRAPEVRLRTSEALGQVFFDQKSPKLFSAAWRRDPRGTPTRSACSTGSAGRWRLRARTPRRADATNESSRSTSGLSMRVTD